MKTNKFLSVCRKVHLHLFLLILVSLRAFCSAGLKTGDMASDFELKDINENSVSLNSILSEGKPVILSFFATWCDTCLDEIKDLSEIAKEFNVNVYLISVDESKSKLDRFLKKHKITFPVLWDYKARTLGKKYDLFRGAFLVIPKLVVISPSGTIQHVSESYSKEKMNSLKSILSQIKNNDYNKLVEIAVFFTSSINGYLESCYCYKHPFGGFIKFLTWLKQQRQRYPSHILLDSGDFLPHSVSENSAKFMFKALETAKYDAIALGDQDVYYSGMIEFIKKKKIPFISSNLLGCGLFSLPSSHNRPEGMFLQETQKADCKMIAEFDKVITINGIKIRIMSFVHPDAFFLYPEEFTNKIKTTQINEIFKKGKNADFLILLSHSGIEYDKKIPEEFDKIDLIIGGHSQTLLDKVVKIKQTLIVQSGGNLQHAGKIVLKFDKDKKLINYDYEVVPLVREIPDDPEIKALIEEQKKSVSGKK